MNALPAKNASKWPSLLATQPMPSLRRPRIMCADDDPDCLELVRLLCRRRDLEVTPFPDAISALDALSAHPQAWDLVLTDHRMPGLSGLDFIKAIRAVHSDLPCILMSSDVSGDLPTLASQAGANAFLDKRSIPKLLTDLITLKLSPQTRLPH